MTMEKLLQLYSLLLFSRCRWSPKELTEKLNCSKSSVLKFIGQIEAAGWCKIIKTKEGREFYYELDRNPFHPAAAPKLSLNAEDLHQMTMCRDFVWHFLPEDMRQNLGATLTQAGNFVQDTMEEKSPSSLEAEKALLGAVLLGHEGALLNALETGLKPDNFYKEAHAEIFRVCLKLDEDRQPVDLMTVTETLKSRETLEMCGGPPYLVKLCDGIDLAASVDRNARIIIDRAILRRLISLSLAIIQQCQDSPPEVEYILDWAESKITKLRSERLTDKFIDSYEELKEVFVEILDKKDKYQQGMALTGLPSGIDALDKLTGGFQKSDLIILAAQPGMGMTSLALNLVLNAALPEKRQTFQQLPPATAAFFSLKMDQKQILLNLICQVGSFNLKDLHAGRISDDDVLRLADAINCLGGAGIFIDDTPALSVLELRIKARRLKGQLQHQGSDLGLVVVDYLQLMRGRGRRGWDNREQEISEISRSLKSLAKELNLPVLALFQLNWKIEKRSGRNPEPRMSDFGESGAIERYADLIVFIRSENSPGENGAPFKLLIRKNRNGPTGDISH